MPTNSKAKILVDSEDLGRIGKYSWYINSSGYAARTVHLGPDPDKKGKYLRQLWQIPSFQ